MNKKESLKDQSQSCTPTGNSDDFTEAHGARFDTCSLGTVKRSVLVTPKTVSTFMHEL